MTYPLCTVRAGRLITIEATTMACGMLSPIRVTRCASGQIVTSAAITPMPIASR